ncbi:MAG: cysteine desulfurase NifS [Acidimicrobiia bacterium]|nr:MAG: cysteine desulfurase NifS [Acidimicrobiia bacterium]
MIYLDNAATTPMRPEAGAAMQPYLGDRFGNPSGVHGVARRAKDAIEEARERIAVALGAAHPLEIVFTGGGTDADNLAVVGSALVSGGGVVTTAVEHDGVLESARFVERLGHAVTIVGVDGEGRVDPSAVVAAVDGNTAVVSVMSANNETGVIQPVSEVADALTAAAPDVLFHTDAVQAFASLPVTVEKTGAAMITVSAHKIGGPQGVGCLYVRKGVELEPVIHGGGQELGRRSGTHNVAGIVGFAAAVEAAVADRGRYGSVVGSARDRFESELASRVKVEVTGADAERLVSHAHLRFPGVPSETLLIRLDQAGIAAAAGAACHSGAQLTSHVLDAMGVPPDQGAEAVRFSFGWADVTATASAAATVVADVVETLQ